MRTLPIVACLSGCATCEQPPEEYTAEVHMGLSHVCLRSNLGQVYCQMYEARDESEDLPQPRSHYAQVSIRGYHVCGLTYEGEVECWARNSGGRNDHIPEGPFVAVESGTWYTCALREDGSASCWGTNDGPATQPPEDDPLAAIVGQSEGFLGIRLDGTLVYWGRDTEDLHHGEVPEGPVERAWAGGVFAAQRSDGSVEIWGRCVAGECDMPEGLDVVDMGIGTYHACALEADGGVVCWGAEESEMFGEVDFGQTDVPAGYRFIDVAAASRATCGLTDTHEVVCWGCWTDRLFEEGEEHAYCKPPTPPWDG